MENNQNTPVKGSDSSLAWMVIIVILIFIAGGVYVFMENNSATSTSVAVSARTTSTSSSTTTVPGMSQYVDSQFSFSFWYPSSWTVTEAPVSAAGEKSGQTLLKRLNVSDPAGLRSFGIDEVSFASSSIAEPDAACMATYSFDTATSQWMQTETGCDGASDRTVPYSTSTNTTGNLPVFTAQEGIGGMSYIIPLATDFSRALVVYGTGEYSNAPIAALDTFAPSGTTISLAAIQAEANAYGVTSTTPAATSTSTVGWQTYTDSQNGFSFEYPSDWGQITFSKDKSEISIGDDVGAHAVVYIPRVFRTSPTGPAETFSQAMAGAGYENGEYATKTFTVGGIQSLGVSSPQDGDSVYVPLPNDEVLEIYGHFTDSKFVQMLSTFKFTN